MLLILFIATGITIGQNKENLSLDEIINRFVLLSSEESESSYLYDFYEQIHENPININSADYQSLSQLPVLDFRDISKIISYRERHKKFKLKNELFKCGIIPSKVEMILPFVKVNNGNEEEANKYISINTRSYAIRSFPDDENRDSYAGNLIKTNNRIKVNYGNQFYFSALADKDAGEKSYYDFLSYNIAYKSNKIISKVVIGSYTVEFGQGLALWSPYSFSKSSNAVGGVIKYSHLLSPYGSSEETRSFYGAGAILNYDDFFLMPFYSERKVSAHTDSIGFYDFNSTGLFRTNAETNSKNNLRILSNGVAAGFDSKMFALKLLYFHNYFSLPFFDKFTGKVFGTSNNIISSSLEFKYKRLLIKGESSVSNGVPAHLYSAEFFITREITFISLFRFYPHNYKALYSNGFGESGSTNNERGFYNGFRFSSAIGKLNIYYDFNKTLFSSSSEDFPVSGDDFLFDFLSNKYRKTKIRVRYHIEKKNRYKTQSIQLLKTIMRKTVERARLALYYQPFRNFHFTTQFDLTRYSTTGINEIGYSLTEQIRINPISILRLYLSVSFFDTESYNTGIYIYENDLNGIFRMSMLYGKGMNWYLLAKLKLGKHFTANIKYSNLYKPKYIVLPQTTDATKLLSKSRLGIELSVNF